MFILRTISKDGVETNLEVGTAYDLIRRDENPEIFRYQFKVHFNHNHVADTDTEATDYTRDCYGFVWGSQEQYVYPLFKDEENYIMTESGKTFSNLTYK